MDTSFEIKDNGLYYQEKLVGVFADPTRHRYAISCLTELLDCAYHPLTKWFMAMETASDGYVIDRAYKKVIAWKNELEPVLSKFPFCSTPHISETDGDAFERSCVIEWYRVFCLDCPIIERYEDMTHKEVEEMIEDACPKEFLCVAGGADEEREEYNSGTLFDLMDVANRSFDGVVNGDSVSMHFVCDAPFIKIADRDLALRVFNPKDGEWTKLMQCLTKAAVRIKNGLWLIAGRSEEDEND